MHDHGRWGGRIRWHIRSNLVGYLALAVALSMAPGYASHLNVKTSDIRNGAVTAPKIRNGAVRPAKIQNGAVRPAKIQNGAVRTAKIFDEAVTSEKIAEGAVGSAQLGDLAVTTIKLDDGAVRAAKLGGTQVATNTGTVANGSNANITATCPAGTRVLGGGGGIDSFSHPAGVIFGFSQPSGNGWRISVRNDSGSTQNIFAQALCLSV